jgi:hypothetical protein
MERVLALLLLAGTAAPCLAQDFRPSDPSVLYFVSLPLDGASRREREPVVGFAFQGRRHYQVLRFDSRILNLIGSGAIEGKYLLVGAVAAGAAIAVGSKSRSETSQEQQQQLAHQAEQQPLPCPKRPAC